MKSFELELKAGNSRRIDLSLARKKGVSIGKTMVLVIPEADSKALYKLREGTRKHWGRREVSERGGR